MCDKNSAHSNSRKHTLRAKRHSAARTDRLNRRNARPNTPLVDLDYNTRGARFTTSRWSVSTSWSSDSNNDNYYYSNMPQTLQRFDLDTVENSCSPKPRSAGGITCMDDHTYHKFSLTPATRPHRHSNHHYDFQPLSTRTATTVTMGATGLSLFVPYCPKFDCDSQANSRTLYSNGGAIRTMGSGGRNGSCGGSGRDGDSPEPSGVHPGQGENGESNDTTGGEDESDGSKPKPSSYTFRRRNAIVEGSEDAPRVDDFPDGSSK